MILGYFGPQEIEAIRRYTRFVNEGMKGEVADPLGGAVSGDVLGSDRFVDWVKRSLVGGIKGTRDLPAVRKLRPRPSVEQIKETLVGRWKKIICGQGT